MPAAGTAKYCLLVVQVALEREGAVSASVRRSPMLVDLPAAVERVRNAFPVRTVTDAADALVAALAKSD